MFFLPSERLKRCMTYTTAKELKPLQSYTELPTKKLGELRFEKTCPLTTRSLQTGPRGRHTPLDSSSKAPWYVEFWGHSVGKPLGQEHSASEQVRAV